MKDETDRTRPNNSNDRSFPSAHASSAFSAARLANRNLDSVKMNRLARTSFQAGNIALAGTVAWTKWLPPNLRKVASRGFGVKLIHAPRKWRDLFGDDAN